MEKAAVPGGYRTNKMRSRDLQHHFLVEVELRIRLPGGNI